MEPTAVLRKSCLDQPDGQCDADGASACPVPVADQAPTIPLAELIPSLRALTDPTRLRIFDLLMQGVQCNCELAASLGLSLSLISHHLRILRRAGLVDAVHDENDARWIYFCINQDYLAQVGSALADLLDTRRIQPRQPSCGPQARSRGPSPG